MPSKRCPMCRRISRDNALLCDCGYQFGQEDIHLVVANLKSQQWKGWSLATSGALITLCGTVIALVLLPIGLLLGALGGGAFVKGCRTIATSRRSTRELNERMKLPAARVIR